MIEGESGKPVEIKFEGDDVSFRLTAGAHYLVRPDTEIPIKFEAITGTEPDVPKKLEPVAIGLSARDRLSNN